MNVHDASLREAALQPASADPDLLGRIMRHDLDKAAVDLPFSQRLARENGWTAAYALRVIQEYKRFIYLACISPDQVTPSDEVDQAWHLHLVYSRDYWGRFCPDVLRRELHHGPTEGGTYEAQRFEQNYTRTLQLYEATFGEKPPGDIWTPPSIRFAAPEKFRRVNLRLFSLKPRRNIQPRSSRAAVLLFAAAFVVVLSLALTRENMTPFGTVFFTLFGTAILYVIGTVLFVVLSAVYRKAWPRPDNQIRQQQHGFTVTYTVGIGVGTATIYSVEVSGTGDSDSSDSGSDGGGDGGGGCGGGCGD
jgi:hypothetical protein